ncbi:sulfatase-like hydrolase/transferase [uncultured Ruegeria sp.]|uniref:sulfatase family protein n=1 Tax=uncultured Ruegeria sp. TaxID=259304 RepID=UPI002610051B|nr:sulfatase-like hydrolase/transferase [uncultured Ruegeria sp.]
MPKQPNFVLFITDQHRGDWLGCAGHPVVKTPHIDAIASKGTRFTDFHVATQICMPNRASLLTGRFPSVHGLRNNGAILPRSANTFVDVLAAAGYRTASIGKSHLQPMTGIRLPEAEVDGQPIKEAWKPDGADYTAESGEAFEARGGLIETPYYGYQKVIAASRHGPNSGGHYVRWLKETAENWQDLLDPTNELPHNYSCPQAFRTPMPEELYPTSFIRDQAMAYLDEATVSDDPFFLFVSFPDPHHPFNPPGKYWDMYDPEDFEVSLPYEAHQNPTPPLKYLKGEFEAGKPPPTPQSAFMVENRHLQEAMALTAGMITMVDDAIGAVIDRMQALGLEQDTVVLFTADHGDYMGDFNMLLKGSPPFRSVTNVPFIWSDPESPTSRVSGEMGSTTDISATILERAGLTPFNGIQGQSLLDAIQGNAGPHKHLFCEFNDVFPRLGFSTPPTVRSLITPDHRLTVYLNEDWGELYDLKADPKETCNLWNDPEHSDTQSDLMLKLTHALIGQMDRSPATAFLA